MANDGVLVYGASGYTGALVAREAREKKLRPVLAGRNAAAVEALARELGCESRGFTLADPAAIAKGLEGMRVVIHCAGPFSHTSKAMADACLSARVHYLDITGEAVVFESLAARDREARGAGILMLPGAGFDVVPSDCLAAHLKRRLPTATALSLAFHAAGAVLSRGTATTMVENLQHGGLVRRGGVLTRVPSGWKTRLVDFGRGPRRTVTIPWGDVSTAFHSTGIPDIEVYTSAGAAQVAAMAVARRRPAARDGSGPVVPQEAHRLAAARPGRRAARARAVLLLGRGARRRALGRLPPANPGRVRPHGPDGGGGGDQGSRRPRAGGLPDARHGVRARLRPRDPRRVPRGPVKDLLIVGAGPSGLAAAIAAEQAGLDYEVLEKGVLVNSIFHFPRAMTFFTTPELLEIGGLPFVTPYEKPTQWEALRYYRRVADTFKLKLRLGCTVRSLRRDGDAFVVGVEAGGRPEAVRARNVALCTGYYDHPNRLGIFGEDLPHVFHYYDEPHAYYRQDVVVVGGKNSAAIAALELCRAGARVTLVHRGAALGESIKYWIRPDIENRIKDGAVRGLFETRVVEIGPSSVGVVGPGGPDEIPASAVFLLTGYHPDASLLAGVGVAIDPETLKPRHDPETLETNVRGLFVGGSVAAGRETSRIFIETGRFHGEAIVKTVANRR